MRLDAIKLQDYLQQKYIPPIKTRPQKLKKGSLASYLYTNRMILFFASLFLLGIFIGTLLAGRASDDTRAALEVVLGGFLEKRQQQSFLAVVITGFSSAAVALLVLFFCGFCSISQIIIILLPIFKGMGYGFTLATFYLKNNENSLLFVILTMLPGILFQTILLLFACKTSMLLSVRLLRGSLTPPEQSERYRLQKYCVKYFIYTVICLIAAIFDAGIYQFTSVLFVI